MAFGQLPPSPDTQQPDIEGEPGSSRQPLERHGPHSPQSGTEDAPPPPLSPKRKGKVIAAVAGAVVAAAVIGAGILTLTAGGSGDYTLSMPATLLDGRFTKFSHTADQGAATAGNPPELDGATAVLGDYRNGSMSVLVWGAYGDLSDPRAVLDTVVTSFTAKDAAPGSEGPREVHPSGFDGDIMKCGTLGTLATLSLPYCAWADDSTVAFVMNVNADASGATKSPSLTEWADSTTRIRTELRVRK
ncbi:hypothetical protein [Actinacidiphila sp. bgisy167]|uniref:hypothetical protein n=1 Tax=Actinacidiphila sp. bgisy167 TaxID=3413797 RepID=UPI003D734E4B